MTLNYSVHFAVCQSCGAQSPVALDEYAVRARMELDGWATLDYRVYCVDCLTRCAAMLSADAITDDDIPDGER